MFQYLEVCWINNSLFFLVILMTKNWNWRQPGHVQLCDKIYNLESAEAFFSKSRTLLNLTKKTVLPNTEKGGLIVLLAITKSLLVCGLYNWSTSIAVSTNIPLNQTSGFYKLDSQERQENISIFPGVSFPYCCSFCIQYTNMKLKKF